VARASAPGFVRLSYSYDADLAVRVDGQPAEFVPDALGAGIILAFPAGAHAIAVDAPRTTQRALLLAASAGLAVGLLAVLAGTRGARGAEDRP
jgi:hypothetical protein